MQYSEAEIGRIFVIRLEDGEKLPNTLEEFALKKGVGSGMCLLIGGVRSDGKMVTGPRDQDARPISPIINQLVGVHEILGAGTIFPAENGSPKLHMHAAAGREGATTSGCIRPGIEIWKVGEVILLELVNNTGCRKKDEKLGFELLSIA